MVERTLPFIRHSHLCVANAIIGELDVVGRRIRSVFVEAAPEEFIRAHYAEHEGKFFFPWILDYHVGNPLLLLVYEGENVIQRIVDLGGDTDPAKALPHTIRARYCTDSQERAVAEERFLENAFHRSADIPTAKYELGVWQPYLKL